MFNPSRKAWAIQFITFNLVGLLNTAIDFMMFTLLSWLGVSILLAQIAAYGAGMVNSYILNNKFTFAKSATSVTHYSKDWKRSLRFFVWNIILLGLSLLMLTGLTMFWSIDKFIAKVVVTIIIVGINFYGSKRWVFVTNASSSG